MKPAQVSALGGCLVQGKPVTRAVQATLAIILAAGPSGISTEGVADEMYLDEMPPNWKAQARVAVSRLRNVMRDRGCDFSLTSVEGHYLLDAQIESIDVWRLIYGEHDVDALVSSADLSALLSGEPFSRVACGPIVAQARRRAIAAQFSLVRHLVDRSDASLLRPVLPLIRELVGRSHLDEYAVCLGVEAHVLCGATKDAQNMVDDFERSLDEDGVPLSEVGRRNLADALTGDSLPASRTLTTDRQPRTTRRAKGFVGREREIQVVCDVATRAGTRSSSSSGIVVLGEEGSGKSAFLDAAKEALEALGQQVVVVVASSHLASSYLPFTSAVPELGPIVRAFANTEDSALNQAARHYEIVQALKAAFPNRPITFLIDQAHDLDTQSLFLVEHLVRASRNESITVIVASDIHADAAGWRDLRESLRHLDVTTLRLSGLRIKDLEMLVRTRHPQASHTAQRQCAAELFRLSRGFPALAFGLLDSADPETLLLGSPRIQPAESRLNQLDDNAKHLAAAGAVLGFEFRVETAARLTGDSEEEVLDALDTLIRNRIVVERDDADLVAFVDAAARSHALRGVSKARAKRWHKAASSFVESHSSRARHLASAVPLVDAELAVRALVTSAMTFFEQFAYREAVEQFRTASKLSNGPLAPEALIAYAVALDRMGAKGGRIRQIAYDEAKRLGDSSLVLRAAVSGLPDTEATDGDVSRVELMLKCDVSSLTQRERFLHAKHLQRQLALLGRTADAAEWGNAAASLARDHDEQASVWLEQWANWDPSSSPRSRLPLRPELATVRDPLLRARLVQSVAIDAYRNGESMVAHDAATRFLELAESAGDPLRIWQAKVLVSLRESLRGNEHAATEAAGAAQAYAFSTGNAHGELGALAYHTLTAWRQGTLADWPEFPSPETYGSHLEAAGVLMVEAHREGISNSVFDRCGLLVENALSNVSMFSVPIVAFLAEISGLDPARRDLAARSDAFLATVDPSHAIVGVGVGHLGPISRARARLCLPGEGRDRLVKRAIAEARQWGLGCWIDHLERFEALAPQILDLRDPEFAKPRSSL